MPLIACLDCRRRIDKTAAKGGRCASCASRTKAAKNRRLRGTAEYQRARAELVAAHLAAHGRWCPGFERTAHELRPSQKLTVDHIVPLAAGGTNDRSNLRVLCDRCNGRKSAKQPRTTR